MKTESLFGDDFLSYLGKWWLAIGVIKETEAISFEESINIIQRMHLKDEQIRK